MPVTASDTRTVGGHHVTNGALSICSHARHCPGPLQVVRRREPRDEGGAFQDRQDPGRGFGGVPAGGHGLPRAVADGAARQLRPHASHAGNPVHAGPDPGELRLSTLCSERLRIVGRIPLNEFATNCTSCDDAYKLRRLVQAILISTRSSRILKITSRLLSRNEGREIGRGHAGDDLSVL
jgi:hypothetical protein